MADKVFTRKQNGPEGGDCTAPYSITVKGGTTVRAFLDQVLRITNEWGHVTIHVAGEDKSVDFSYRYGKITSAPKNHWKYIDYVIECANGSGGWSCMDYILEVSPAEPKAEQKVEAQAEPVMEDNKMEEYRKYLEEELKKAEKEFEDAKKESIKKLEQMTVERAWDYGAAYASYVDKVTAAASRVRTIGEALRTFNYYA